MKQEEHHFVTWLEKFRGDRAVRAKLRRGLGKRMGSPEMYPYVATFLPEKKQEQEYFFLVASLFALHPDPAPKGRTMGSVFKALKENSESIEKRFVIMLGADEEEIGGHLRQAISLAKTKGITIDYHQLLNDLRCWSYDDRRVQLQWAKDYWKNNNNNNAANAKGDNKS